MLKLNLIDNQLTYQYKCSDKYKEGFWGVGDYTLTYNTINEEASLFLYSFPADEYVYAMSAQENSSTKYLAQSSYIDLLTPTYESKEVAGSYLETTGKYRAKGGYGPVYYDKYRELYYRFAFHPLPEKEAKFQVDPIDKQMPLSVIILDKHFAKIGETVLSYLKYDPYTVFITKEGLHISHNKPDNEDELIFDIFLPTPISE